MIGETSHSNFFPDGYRHPFFSGDLQLAVEVVVVLNGQETHRNPALLWKNFAYYLIFIFVIKFCKYFEQSPAQLGLWEVADRRPFDTGALRTFALLKVQKDRVNRILFNAVQTPFVSFPLKYVDASVLLKHWSDVCITPMPSSKGLI